MRFRRSLSLLSGLCALSLTLCPGNSGCENDRGESHATLPATATQHAAMPMPSQDGNDQKPCGSAAVVCCHAMTSCGMSVQVSSTVSTIYDLPRGNCIPTVPFQTALTRILSPEPPPPKA
jgi:hypothetical protein